MNTKVETAEYSVFYEREYYVPKKRIFLTNCENTELPWKQYPNQRIIDIRLETQAYVKNKDVNDAKRNCRLQRPRRL